MAAPPALQQVAQRFAATTQGIVGFRLHRVLEVRAGFSSRHEDVLVDGVYRDGTIVRVRILTYTIDGKPAGDADRATMIQAYQAPKPGQLFHVPFDARYVAEYQYVQSGPRTIAFSSTIQDGSHGDGTFTYDAAGDVLSYTYQPNALPPHATSGTIVDRRAEVLPNDWRITYETQQYKGSYGPFPGRANEEVDFYGFRRFTDLQSAIGAL